MGAQIEVIARGVASGPRGILICRNVKHGYLYLPGGHIEFNETGATALAREFLEETGLKIEVGPLLLVHESRFTQNGKARHEVNLVFHVEHSQLPEVVPSIESHIAFDWVPPTEIAGSRLLPEAIRPWLAECPQTREIHWLSSGA
ncbi:MAG: NUDIX domain-containing protein [Phycisphaeraceae bacterium]|nr:NUDIX domain-containing protein [Phycisphaeraceae bacterium]